MGMMGDSFYKALLALILVPYAFICLMLVWNIVGPSLRKVRRPPPDPV
jgi:hypothetical protein